jgi:membrane protease YdiL (CAAX protease family)
LSGPHGKEQPRLSHGLDPQAGWALVCICVWSLGAALARLFGIWAGIGGAAVTLGLLSLLLMRRMLLPLLRPSARLVAWGVAAGVAMLLVTYSAYPLVLRGPAFLTSGVAPLYAILNAAGPVWVSRALLPFIIVSEELVWRGVVLGALLAWLPPLPAIFLSAVLYTTGHAPLGSLYLTVVAVACGLYWSALRFATGSLIPSLICHLLWDLLVFVLRPLA